MFGGIGLGAAILALERTLQRPVIWATAQYASFAKLDSIVDFDVHTIHAGKSLTQARVLAHVDDRHVLSVSAALGERPGEPDQWLQTAPAPAPQDCPPVPLRPEAASQLVGRLERRVVEGHFPQGAAKGARQPSGRLRWWVRSTEGIPVSAAYLAFLADFVVEGISHAMGYFVRGNSLDNTIRFGPIVPGEWVLCDFMIEAIHGGISHSTMKMFSQDGVLMASASQSLILRLPGGEGEASPHAGEATPV